MRWHIAIAALGACASLIRVPAAAQACTRAEFETVVGEAAKALRVLNRENRPLFQSKLRELMARRKWSQDRFLKEAAPIVQDGKTDAFDKESTDLLEKIQRMGAEGSAASTPDCAKLVELRGYMDALVKAQRAKWEYLFAKIGQELRS